MKKLGKIVLILAIVGGLVYAGILVFVNPAGFVNKEDLTKSYITNIATTDVCETHFNTETQSACEIFKDSLSGHTVSVVSTTVSGENVVLVLDIDGTQGTFTVLFVEEEVTGLKGILNKYYYYIDVIL